MSDQATAVMNDDTIVKAARAEIAAKKEGKSAPDFDAILKGIENKSSGEKKDEKASVKDTPAKPSEEKPVEEKKEEKLPETEKEKIEEKEPEKKGEEDKKPPEPEKKVDTEKDKAKEEADRNAEIEAYAKENQLSLDAARDELSHIANIKEKYKSDKELAKATLHLQRAYTRNQEELNAIKNDIAKRQEISQEAVVKAIEGGKIETATGRKLSREEVILAYRQQYPDITEAIADDDTIVRMAAKEIKTVFDQNRKDQQAKTSVAARERRVQLISSLPINDSQYLPEIRPILENLSDDQILDEKFSLNDLVLWAKGKRYEKSIKEAEERGFKRGKEDARIITEKPPVGGGTVMTNKEKTTGIQLSDEDKKRALEMFDNSKITDEEKYKLFVEIKKARKK